MMKIFKNQISLFIIYLITTTLTFAASVPTWEIVPDQSNITFTGTQNNAPVSGKFKTFSGTINFDPQQLKDSHVEIVIDIGSVSTSYKDIEDALRTSDWFDAKLFPNATFKATKFSKKSANVYEADGTLTIRDKTQPVVIDFTTEEYSDTKARVRGTATLKRTNFEVGKGEWANTDDVKDDVKVEFTITAIKK